MATMDQRHGGSQAVHYTHDQKQCSVQPEHGVASSVVMRSREWSELASTPRKKQSELPEKDLGNAWEGYNCLYAMKAVLHPSTLLVRLGRTIESFKQRRLQKSDHQRNLILKNDCELEELVGTWFSTPMPE